MNSKKPIIKKFRDIPAGTKFRIYAEPSRELRSEDITDTNTYEKVCAAYSTCKATEKDIILYPNDLVSIVAWPRKIK